MRRSFSGCGDRIFDLPRQRIQRKMFSDTIAFRNGVRDDIFSDLHRVRQVVAERQRGANRGGISAARAVRRNALDEGRG